MPREPSRRQPVHPQDSRRLPWQFRVSKVENAALVTVAAIHKSTPQDLIRERGLNDIVEEYRRVTAQVVAATG